VSIAVTGRRGDRLAVEITNPVTDLAPPDTTGAGLGLVGIAERADLLGGSMSHGIRAGSFELTASLPWTEAA
jgi:signal transduction histidine kinase